MYFLANILVLRGSRQSACFGAVTDTNMVWAQNLHIYGRLD